MRMAGNRKVRRGTAVVVDRWNTAYRGPGQPQLGPSRHHAKCDRRTQYGLGRDCERCDERGYRLTES
jgi:hypothetical protein